MIVSKSFRFRLYPNKEQQQTLAQQFGASRWVWNHFLRQRIDHYAMHKKGLTYYDNCRELPRLKEALETAWLREANAQALQQTLADLQTAYRNFFERRAKYPRFKSKRSRQSFRVPQGFKLDGDHLIIPKVSPIKIVVHRPVQGRMKSVTISCIPTGKYFASIFCEVEMEEPVKNQDKPAVGIDLGLIDFAVTSDGQHFPHPKYLRRAEKQLARAQRVLSRRQKGSNGRQKAKLRVARLHEQVANQRADFLHKLSKKLIDENQAIFFEDLSVKNMLANHCLAKSISDSGWAEFFRLCDYKGRWYGCDVAQIDRFVPSSKRCADCGHVVQALPLSIREWACPNCGVIHDRDENASANILTFGLASRAGTARTHTPVESRVACSLKPEALQLAAG